MSALRVNGKDHPVDADPNMPLLWVLRDIIGLTGRELSFGALAKNAAALIVD